jgi:3-hydroxyacyl-CoA dehydrogenase
MHITILGSGIMGSQLAALMSLLDFDVTIRSRNNNLNFVEKNKKLLSKIIKLDFKSNIINYKNINESFDGQSLVIECLKENLQIKKEYFIKSDRSGDL